MDLEVSVTWLLYQHVRDRWDRQWVFISHKVLEIDKRLEYKTKVLASSASQQGCVPGVKSSVLTWQMKLFGILFPLLIKISSWRMSSPLSPPSTPPRSLPYFVTHQASCPQVCAAHIYAWMHSLPLEHGKPTRSHTLKDSPFPGSYELLIAFYLGVGLHRAVLFPYPMLELYLAWTYQVPMHAVIAAVSS